MLPVLALSDQGVQVIARYRETVVCEQVGGHGSSHAFDADETNEHNSEVSVTVST